MGLELPKLEIKGGFVEADQDYFLTSDKQTLVEETDPEAAFLLARRGQMIPLETAKGYGLLGGNKADFEDTKTSKKKAKSTKQGKTQNSSTDDDKGGKDEEEKGRDNDPDGDGVDEGGAEGRKKAFEQEP